MGLVGWGATGDLPQPSEETKVGASALFIKANWDVGGNARLSGGNAPFGGRDHTV